MSIPDGIQWCYDNKVKPLGQPALWPSEVVRIAYREMPAYVEYSEENAGLPVDTSHEVFEYVYNRGEYKAHRGDTGHLIETVECRGIIMYQKVTPL